MTTERPWWAELYSRQHEIWPGWSRSDRNAPETADFITRLIGARHPGLLLDLGCGVGKEACAFAQLGWRAFGIDLAEPLIAEARARAARLGVEDRVMFTVANLRENITPPGPADLILLWDSTLAIWSEVEQETILHRWIPYLAGGGSLVISQLGREYFALRGRIGLTITDPSVGLGHSERTYCWSEEDGVLLDSVVWHPPDGRPPETLPTQRLHLLEVRQIEQLLLGVGLREVEVVGAEGWAWRLPGRRPPTADSRQIVAVGRKR